MTEKDMDDRGDEIWAWIKENRKEVGRAVILDDDDDMGLLMPMLVQTDREEGLSLGDVRECILTLEKPWVEWAEATELEDERMAREQAEFEAEIDRGEG